MLTIHADSTSDLGPELSARHNFNVIPLYVLLREKSFLDSIEIKTPDLFTWTAETGELPKTSAISVGDFIKHFEQPGEHLYIGISSQLSATVKNAQIAASMLPNQHIRIIDSMNLSSGEGLLLLKAAEMRDKGWSIDEIHTKVELSKTKVRTSFIIETLDYLYKGGRCSAMQNIMSSLLSIRPTIAMRPDGTLGVKAKTRGTRKRSLLTLIEDFKRDLPNIDLSHVFITHTGAEEDAALIYQELVNLTPIENIHRVTAGSVIASHCGPGTLGLVYIHR